MQPEANPPLPTVDDPPPTVDDFNRALTPSEDLLLSSLASLDAGDFRTWTLSMEAAMRGLGESDVPCGSCTACCTSSQFILVEPDETRTLGRIPTALLFPAPRMPKGHQLMGYDSNGHCPMFIDNRCSIYTDRPRACRLYDCRIFPASGVLNDDPGKDAIAAQAVRWRFSYEASSDVVLQEAINAAAAFVRKHRERLFADPMSAKLRVAPPNTSTQLAVLAFQVRDLFLGKDATGAACVMEPDVAAVQRRLSPPEPRA